MFESGPCFEVGSVENGEKISGIKESADDQDDDRDHPITLQRTQNERPLAKKSVDGRNTSQSHGSDCKRTHRPWHHFGNSVQLRNFRFMQVYVNRSGTEKECNFHGCMCRDVHDTPLDTQWRQQSDSQYDVGKMPDGGVGKPAL